MSTDQKLFRELTGGERTLLDQLRKPANAAGVVDLDALRLGDLSTIKTDEQGVVTNGAEWIAALKEAKPHLFADEMTPKSALSMSREQYARARHEAVNGPSTRLSSGAAELSKLPKLEYAARRAAILRS